MTTAVNTLDARTTEQLLAKVLGRSAENDPALRIVRGGTNDGNAPSAVLDDDLIQLVRLLAALMAVNLASTRLPISAVRSEDNQTHEEDWQRFFL